MSDGNTTALEPVVAPETNADLLEIQALIDAPEAGDPLPESAGPLIKSGKRFSTFNAQQERVYAHDLARNNLSSLQRYGITPEVIARLLALGPELTNRETRYQELYQAQMAMTQKLATAEEGGLDLLAQVWTLARKALGKDSPSLAALPPRTRARQSTADMIVCLVSAVGFVKQYLAQLLKARMPVELPAQLELGARRVSLCNEIQEKLMAAVSSAHDRVSYARGDIYQVTGQVYEAGKSVYRRDRVRYEDYCYKYMVRRSSTPSDDPAEVAARKALAEAKKSAAEAKKAAAAEVRKVAAARAAEARAAQTAAKIAALTGGGSGGESGVGNGGGGSSEGGSGVGNGVAAGSMPGAGESAVQAG